MKRAGHFLLTTAAAVSGIFIELYTEAPGIVAHIGAVAPFLLAGAKWLHFEITNTPNRGP